MHRTSPACTRNTAGFYYGEEKEDEVAGVARLGVLLWLGCQVPIEKKVRKGLLILILIFRLLLLGVSPSLESRNTAHYYCNAAFGGTAAVLSTSIRGSEHTDNHLDPRVLSYDVTRRGYAKDDPVLPRQGRRK